MDKVSLAYCHQCRRKHGFIAVDNYAHTARRKKCESCNKIKSILPDRHWKVEYPSGMILQ